MDWSQKPVYEHHILVQICICKLRDSCKSETESPYLSHDIIDGSNAPACISVSVKYANRDPTYCDVPHCYSGLCTLEELSFNVGLKLALLQQLQDYIATSQELPTRIKLRICWPLTIFFQCLSDSFFLDKARVEVTFFDCHASVITRESLLEWCASIKKIRNPYLQYVIRFEW